MIQFVWRWFQCFDKTKTEISSGTTVLAGASERRSAFLSVEEFWKRLTCDSVMSCLNDYIILCTSYSLVGMIWSHLYKTTRSALIISIITTWQMTVHPQKWTPWWWRMDLSGSWRYSHLMKDKSNPSLLILRLWCVYSERTLCWLTHNWCKICRWNLL